MPIYEAQCARCGDLVDYFQPIDQRHLTPTCACGGETRRIISAVKGFGDIPDYVSPVTGRPVSGRKQRIEDLKRTNSRPWEGMEQESREAARQKRYAEQRDDQRLTEAAHKAFADLPPTARKALESTGPAE